MNLQREQDKAKPLSGKKLEAWEATYPLTIAKIKAQATTDGRREADEAKDQAYRERNMLVAALTKMFPAHLHLHPKEDTDWEVDWRTIVCIDLPTGQATWHIHDSEKHLFSHLDWSDENHWDGHTTEEKYDRLSRLAEYKKELE